MATLQQLSGRPMQVIKMYRKKQTSIKVRRGHLCREAGH